MKFKRTLAILLSALLLICGLSVTAMAADTGAGIAVEADKDHAVTGDVITYTVTLIDSDKVDGGIYNYEFALNVGAGLEYVAGSGKIADTNTFAMATFNEGAMFSSAMGLTGATGFTGSSMVLVTFQCKVTDAAAGNAIVSVEDIVLTCYVNGNSVALYPADSSVSVHANTLIAQAGQDASCTEPGVKAHDKCSICGKLFIDGVEVTDVTAPAKGHGETEVKDAKDASCTEPGYTGDTYCKDCGEKLSSGEEIPAKGHNYGDDNICDDCGHETELPDSPDTADAGSIVLWSCMMVMAFAAAAFAQKRKNA